MSKISLTAFATFKLQAAGVPPDILCGAADVRLDPVDGKIQLLIGNVPFRNKNLVAPVPGLCLLYGFMDVTTELSLQRNYARSIGAQVQDATIEMEIGDIYPGQISREILRNLRFANFKRMATDLKQDVENTFEQYVLEEGGRVDPNLPRYGLVASRPDLFGRLLKEDKDFKKLEVLVIPIQDEDGKIRQVAYVKSGHYIDIIQNADKVVLVLPKTFTKVDDKKAA